MSFSIVQHVNAAMSASTGSITVAATGAGNLGVIYYNNGSGNRTITGITGGGSWVAPSGAATTSANAGGCAGAYCLSLPGSVTSFSVTVNSTSSTGWLEFIEYSFTGPSVSFDTSGIRSETNFLTSISGVALTLSGTNDLIVQAIASSAAASSAGTGYTNPFEAPATTNYAFAGRMNTNDGSANTWTVGSTTVADLSAMAFSEASASGPMPPLLGPHSAPDSNTLLRM